MQDKQDTQHHKYLFMIIMSLILNVLFDDEMSLSKFNQVLFLTNNHNYSWLSGLFHPVPMSLDD